MSCSQGLSLWLLYFLCIVTSISLSLIPLRQKHVLPNSTPTLILCILSVDVYLMLLSFPSAGTCVIGRPSGEQEPRGVSVSRCKACWLKICLDKFVLEPNTREVIHQHYLPVFVVGGTAVTLSGQTNTNNSDTKNSPVASGLRTSSSVSTSPALTLIPSSSLSNVSASNNSNTHHPTVNLSSSLSVKREPGSSDKPPPLLPLPSRKRKIKELPFEANNNSNSSHGSSNHFLMETSADVPRGSVNFSFNNNNNHSQQTFLVIGDASGINESVNLHPSSSSTNSRSGRSQRKANGSSVKYKKVETKHLMNVKKSDNDSKESKGAKGRSRGGKKSLVVKQEEVEESIVDALDEENMYLTTTGSAKKRRTSGKGSRSNRQILEDQSSELTPVRRRRRKAKGFLTHNLDHDYGGSMMQDQTEGDEDSDENNESIDVIEHGFCSNIEEVVVKMETTEDLNLTDNSTHHHHYKTSGVVLRESNEDHDNHQSASSRSRLGSFGAANANVLLNLSYRLGIHPRVEPESPKAATKAEDVTQSIHDPNLYSVTDPSGFIVSSAEEVMIGGARDFNDDHCIPLLSTPIKGSSRKKKNAGLIHTGVVSTPKKRKVSTKTASASKDRRLNQENQSSSGRCRKTSSSTSSFASSCFTGDTKYSGTRVTSVSSCSDDLTDSLSGFLSSDHNGHHHHNLVHRRLHHHHPRYHHHPSTQFQDDLDDDNDSLDDEAVDDDEGYDDYFDPVAVRDARDSLFFDEILNTNSPFL